MVAALQPEDIVQLDPQLRAFAAWRGPYLDVLPDELSELEDVSPLILALCASHRSGYVRQQAVRRLGKAPEVDAWPFLLLRLNDWVSEVRRTALQVVLSLLPQVPVHALVRYLPLVERLGLALRARHDEVVARVHQRLLSPEALPVVKELLPQLPLRIRRETYRLMLSAGGEGDTVLRALEDRDPVIQAWAAARAPDIFTGGALLRVLERLERSRSMMARREAFVTYAQKFHELANRKLRLALLDRHPSIRDYARRRLGLDAAAFYREALTQPDPCAAAVAGLGEVGTARDADSLETLLRHPRILLRREAVKAVGKLGGPLRRERLMLAFGDPSPGVVRAAARGLIREAGSLPLEWVRRWLSFGAEPYQVRAALPLVGAMNRWDGLELILGLFEARLNPAQAEQALATWLGAYNSRFVAPRTEQLDRLRARLASLSSTRPKLSRNLQHLLNAFA
jgi:HEAT repeat protein